MPEKPENTPSKQVGSSDLFAMSPKEEILGQVMQDIWNDHCVDTGCIPCAFTIHGPQTTKVSAELLGSSFVSQILDHLPLEFWDKE